jgi:hypothetical protein
MVMASSLGMMRDPMRYTLGQAAKATGTSKMTIQRALKAGRISGDKDETGAYSLDPAEVHRVFPLVRNVTGSTASQWDGTRPLHPISSYRSLTRSSKPRTPR